MIAAVLIYIALAPPPVEPVVGPPAPVADEDPAVLRRRLEQAMRDVEEKLRKQIADQSTQDLQKAILKDLDQLLKRLQNPPPQDANQQPQPKQPAGDSPNPADNPFTSAGGGKPGDKSPKTAAPEGQSQGGGHRRERKSGSRPQSQDSPQGEQSQKGGGRPPSRDEQRNAAGPKPGDAAGNPGANPDKSSGATMPNQVNGQPDKMADVYRDVWGHLPESLRQEVDHYYRDRFMPKYQELLRQYYIKLAEADRKNEPKK